MIWRKMASSSHDTRRASSNAPECIEEVFTMEHHYYKRLRPRSLIHGLKDVSTLQCYSNDPEEQLLQNIRDGASVELFESHLNLTFRNISDRVDEEINGEVASGSLDEQRNGRKRAIARARVYDKALGEAKDDTPIEEFLVKKLQTDECWQRGGHCAMVDCSAVRWNMTNIVLALIRWRGGGEDGRFFKKEELLAIAVEYGHVKLVQQLTKMQDIDVNIGFSDIWEVFTIPGSWDYARLTDRKKKFQTIILLFSNPLILLLEWGM